MYGGKDKDKEAGGPKAIVTIEFEVPQAKLKQSLQELLGSAGEEEKEGLGGAGAPEPK